MGKTVYFNTVYDRLLESGLQKTFAGEIHCYNCHSAEHNKDGKDGPFYGEPYAVRFANYMYTNGYKSCTYFGYLGPLDSFPKDGTQGLNVYSRKKAVEVVDGKRKQVLKELGTWDMARVKIHPTIDLRPPTLGQKIKKLLRKVAAVLRA